MSNPRVGLDPTTPDQALLWLGARLDKLWEEGGSRRPREGRDLGPKRG